jgi:hypothetical protein
MKGTYKAIIIILAIAVLAVGGVLLVKRQLWKAQPADAITIKQKEQSPVDLRPAAIAKLQAMVLQASDSLYKLRIDSLLTEMGSGTIVLRGVGLYPDSNSKRRLHSQQRLPDDVFEIELKSLRITGIGLDNIIHRRDIHLQSISCSTPQIIVHHKAQPYNAEDRAQAHRTTLFGRLKGKIDRLAIDSIRMRHGVLVDYTDGQKNVFHELSVLLTDILIDSVAEKDNTRCLFAKKMQLDAGSITLSDGIYDLSLGGITVLGNQKEVTVKDFAMLPKGGKEAAARQQKERTSIFTIKAPTVKLKGANWWAAVNRESLIASEADITGANVNVYTDGRVPAGPVERDNFPHQKLAGVKMPVSLKQVILKGATLVCEAFNPLSGEQGRMVFGDLSLDAPNVTNLPAEVAAKPVIQVKGSGMFMNTTPLSTVFTLDLRRNSHGAFKVDMKMGHLDKEPVNTFSEAMGLVHFKSGQMESANGHVEGNNDQLHGTITARYTDLHLEPLKRKGDEIKEKNVTGKLANILFVKDNNPSKGKLRQPDFSLDRTTESNFFAFVWEGLKLGLLKMIGVPPKLGMKKK